MIEWFQPLQRLLDNNKKVVMVMVAAVQGSTPRDAGARMLVTETGFSQTIGGGHLEYKAIQIARNMLTDGSSNRLQYFSLGAGLGQCCGGRVALYFELITSTSSWLKDFGQLILQQQNFVQVIALSKQAKHVSMLVTANKVIPDNCKHKEISILARNWLANGDHTDINCIRGQQYIFDPLISETFNLYLFGAGHVGQALVKQLEDQPCRVYWVDSRENQFPQQIPSNVKTIHTDTGEAIIDEAAAGSYFLVMTHDHGEDQRLAEQILKKKNYQYFGLIGSLTKRRKFEQRLKRRGFQKQQLSSMTCPVGIDGIKSKRPAAIALAITAEIIQIHEKTLNYSVDNFRQTINKELTA